MASRSQQQQRPATSVFVYGTLKRGQCRERCWPRRPTRIELATIVGQLYDLGHYPAWIPGEGRVEGELWSFHEADLPATLRELDAIEGYAQKPTDLYRRVVIECTTFSGEEAWAFTYQYIRTGRLDDRLQIPPDSNGLARWPVM
ncbi:MAG: gamma-glutamylcyclotransferase family protein [Pirellulaceae bacterium]|nr:gamma-glutamylcyclotransferase [Planctomycetales bacterium]